MQQGTKIYNIRFSIYTLQYSIIACKINTIVYISILVHHLLIFVPPVRYVVYASCITLLPLH